MIDVENTRLFIKDTIFLLIIEMIVNRDTFLTLLQIILFTYDIIFSQLKLFDGCSLNSQSKLKLRTKRSYQKIVSKGHS